ncbi:hypothetical protein B0T21DRAFT_344540 [Apiosordaria backusii]|uniref:Uncharacterized protein n=1 Tax=Apiosordaria backusii TaxID=314023 RepID=A0AA40K396_9PEZI|nr:hypothetical protein B0T21DRAFT_344540 [Apiosordaria backusii]
MSAYQPRCCQCGAMLVISNSCAHCHHPQCTDTRDPDPDFYNRWAPKVGRDLTLKTLVKELNSKGVEEKSLGKNFVKVNTDNKKSKENNNNQDNQQKKKGRVILDCLIGNKKIYSRALQEVGKMSNGSICQSANTLARKTLMM